MRAWAFWTCFWLFLDVVYGQLTTWDNQLFDFGWSPYDPTIVRCSTIQMGWTERQTSSPDSQPPYSIYVLRGGYLPIQIATVAGKNYNWTVELPTGGPYLLYMTDASGYTGGTSLIFNIQDATSGSCGTSTLTTTSLALTDDGNTAECSAITVTAQGTAPYTMQVMVAQVIMPLTVRSQHVNAALPAASQNDNVDHVSDVMVTDASGNVGLNGLHTVTNGDDSCYGVAPTITVGSAPTTLSYTPPSSSSSTRTTDSNTRGSQTATVLANTASQALTSVFTLANGSSTTLVLDPGESVSVPIVASTK
ncbi:hypothetical protein FRC19_009510 [Serendipita sp. 401]|nr:hypothetical protein FRC19_009510 [Serendipita sp. 401]